jgi:dihydroorotate dehydrogenase
MVEPGPAVRIPVAVKLSPFYSALAHVARELDRAGADGLVLFNRFIARTGREELRRQLPER